VGRIDAEAADLIDAGLGDVVLGQARDEGGVHAELRDGHGDVDLGAAEGHLQFVGLDETQDPGGESRASPRRR
jgi:hypothetical protein